MNDSVIQWLGYINDVCRIFNPFLFLGATLIWIRLYWCVQKEMNRNVLRQYCIESQIDHIVNSRDIDFKYIEHVRKIYAGYGINK